MANTGKNSTKVHCVSITFCVSFERSGKMLSCQELGKLGWCAGKRELESETVGESQKPRLPTPDGAARVVYGNTSGPPGRNASLRQGRSAQEAVTLANPL